MLINDRKDVMMNRKVLPHTKFPLSETYSDFTDDYLRTIGSGHYNSREFMLKNGISLKQTFNLSITEFIVFSL